ncbi:MAG: MraY family glycosyltransferase [Parcubacteria group bacterium]|jgi:UDP-GlcNAc:undecaprenyl-phosphate GlcNAc-1-phosphate transferase
MTKFLLPFLYSLGTTVVTIYFLIWLKKKYNYSAIKRFGGLVIILVFIAFVLADKNLVITGPIWGIIIGGALIFIFGLWDDLKNLNWKWQLLFQIIIAVTVIFFGVRSGYIAGPLGGLINLGNPIIYFALFTAYFLVFINSLNWLDGVDGLSGGVAFVALVVIFLLSFKPEVNQPAVAILCSILGGTILAFLIFNFSPARIFAGTSGAWFFGFALAALSIFAGAKIATTLIAVLIPVLDFIWVILERYREGQSIFSKDDRHLHFKLLKFGIGEVKVVLFLCFLTLLIGAASLALSASGKIFLMVIFSFLYFFTISKLKAKIENI